VRPKFIPTSVIRINEFLFSTEIMTDQYQRDKISQALSLIYHSDSPRWPWSFALNQVAGYLDDDILPSAVWPLEVDTVIHFKPTNRGLDEWFALVRLSSGFFVLIYFSCYDEESKSEYCEGVVGSIHLDLTVSQTVENIRDYVGRMAKNYMVYEIYDNCEECWELPEL